MVNRTSGKPIVPPAVGLLVGVLSASTAAPLIRIAQREAPSLAIAALRLVFAAVILTPFVLANHRDEIRKLEKKTLISLTFCGLLLALHFATWISSLEYTTVAVSVVLVATTPLWVALLSPLVLHEKIKPLLWAGLGLALFGGVLVGFSQVCEFSGMNLACTDLAKGRSYTGNFLALTGALTFTGYLLIGRKYREKLPLIVYIWIVYGTAALFLLVASLAAGNQLASYSGTVYLVCLVLALGPQLLGHSSYNWALRYLPAAVIAVAQLGEPVSSAVLAFFLLKEIPSVLEVVGGCLILAGIFLTARLNTQTEPIKLEASKDPGEM